MTVWNAAGAARWIAEAVESGNPLGALPAEIAPRDVADGAEVAAAVLDALGIVPCGVRILRRAGAVPLIGPMIEGRLMPNGATIALGALRHPAVTVALVGVLAEALDPDSDAPPVFGRLHPALDVSATRFSEPTDDEAVLTADLARLGLVVVGKGKAAMPGMVRVALGARGSRVRGVETDLGTAFGEAATAARTWGGLPPGALLVVAGLTAPVAAEGTLRASLGAAGGATAVFAR